MCNKNVGVLCTESNHDPKLSWWVDIFVNEKCSGVSLCPKNNNNTDRWWIIEKGGPCSASVHHHHKSCLILWDLNKFGGRKADLMGPHVQLTQLGLNVILILEMHRLITTLYMDKNGDLCNICTPFFHLSVTLFPLSSYPLSILIFFL